MNGTIKGGQLFKGSTWRIPQSEIGRFQGRDDDKPTEKERKATVIKKAGGERASAKLPEPEPVESQAGSESEKASSFALGTALKKRFGNE
ncbi:MAG: hypothetical protein FVQ81_18265 [Candidatus Glassbacteria bacterium]|nr:hypothetical protein [Candidatus Glassbacteria bacterium]